MEYAERLHVPLRWWAQGTMLVATFWLAVVVATPAPVAWTVTAVALVVMTGGFRAFSARVEVRDGELRAGRAHVSLDHVGVPEVLDVEQTRRLSGVEADARAYLLLRPYLKRAVRVPLTDPADPTPYWLVHSRHPQQLADALVAAGAGAASSRRMPDPAAG